MKALLALSIIFSTLGDNYVGGSLKNLNFSFSPQGVRESSKYSIYFSTTSSIPNDAMIKITLPSECSISTSSSYDCTLSNPIGSTDSAYCSSDSSTLTVTVHNFFSSGAVSANYMSLFAVVLNVVSNPKTNQPTSSIDISVISSSSDVIDSDSSSSITVIKAIAATISSAEIASSSDVVGNLANFTFTLTPTHSIQSSSIIQIKFPYWNQNMNPSTFTHMISGSTPVCVGTSNIANSLTCDYSTSSQILKISGGFSSDTLGSLSFTVYSCINPPNPNSFAGFIIYLKDTYGYDYEISRILSLQVSTPNLITISNIGLGISTVSSLTTIDITFNIKNPMTSRFFIDITVPSDIFFDSKMSVTGKNGVSRRTLTRTITGNKIRISNGYSSYSSSSLVRVALRSMTLPSSTKTTGTFTISTLTSSGGIIDTGTGGTITATEGELIANGAKPFVTAESYVVGASTTYYFEFIITHSLPSDAAITITFPNTIVATTRSAGTCTSLISNVASNAICEINSGILTLIEAFPDGLSAGKPIKFGIDSITNPSSTATTSSFTYITYTNSSLLYRIDKKNLGITFTPKSATLRGVTVTPTSDLVGEVTTFTFTIETTTTTSVGGYLMVTFPIGVSVSDIVKAQNNCEKISGFNSSTFSCIATTSSVRVNSAFASGSFSPGTLSFSVGYINNPISTKPVQSFSVSTFDSNGYTIDSLSTGILVQVNTINELTSASVSIASLVNSASTTYTFSIKPKTSTPVNCIIYVIPPSSISFPSIPKCTSTVSIISAISCSLQVDLSLKAIVTLTSTASSSQTIAFSVSNIINPPTTEPTSTFKIYTNTSDDYGIDKKESGVTVETAIAATLTTIYVTANTSKISESAFYQIEYIPVKTHPSGTVVKITIPSEFTLGTVSCSSTTLASLTCESSGYDVITSGFENSVSNSEFVNITISGITNPTSQITTSAWSLISKTGNYLIDTSASVTSKFTCTSPCLTCETLPTTCQSCVNTGDYQYLYSHICISACPPGSVDDITTLDKVCVSCSSICKTCSGTPNTCLSCNPGTYPYLFNNNCISNCLLGYYAEEFTCIECKNPCLTCSSATECNSCTIKKTSPNLGSPTYFYRGSCNVTCPAGYLGNSVSYACDICDVGYGKNGSYCEPCKENCTCLDAGECSGCIKGYVYINDSDLNENTGFCIQGHRYVKKGNIISKLMNSGFTSIQVTLNQDIIISSSNCSDYFVNYEVFGHLAACSVTGRRILNIILGDDVTASDKTDLMLAKTFLLDTFELSISTISINVDFSEAYSITAAIRGVQTLSDQCSTSTYNIVFSGFSSEGSLRRRFSYSWVYIGDYSITSESGKNTDKYSFSVNLTSSNTRTFTVELTVDDGISNSTANHTVLVIDFKTIKFELDAGATSFKASDDISISTIVTDACSCSKGFNYQWNLPDSSGLNLLQSKLRIPGKKFTSYGDKNISLTLECKDKTVSGTASSTIKITPSSLVADTNKGDQQISDLFDLTIDGSGSYDPDGFSISYAWTLDSQTLNSTSSKILIPKASFSSLASFVVILEIKSTNGDMTRTASKSHKFTVLVSNPLSLTLDSPSKKVTISSQVTIVGKLSGGGSTLTYTWSLISGPPVDFQIYWDTLVIPSGNLESGASYSFKLVAQSELNMIEVSSAIFVNSIPSCDSTLELNPASGTKLTSFTISTTNCVDGDNEDLPLSFHLSVRVSGRFISIKNNIWPSITTRLPCGIDRVRIDVCDTLSDCIALSNKISVSCSRRSLKEDIIDMQEYLDIKLYFDTFETISVVLFLTVNDEALLDLIWKDFIEYVQDEFKTIFLTRQIISTILSLIEKPQNEKLMIPRFHKYINFLTDHLSKSSSIDDLSQEYLKDIAERLCIVDTSDATMQLSLDVLKSLARFFSIPGVPYTQNTTQITFYQIETTLNKISPIVLGSNMVALNDAGFDENSMIIIEAASLSSAKYSDKVQISVTSKRFLGLSGIGEFEIVKEMDTKKEGCVIRLPYKGIQAKNVACLFDGGENNCDVLDTKDNIATITVYKSGTYTVGYKDNKSFRINDNFYLVISLILLCVLSMPLMSYLDILYPYVPVPTVPMTSKSDKKVSKFETDVYYNDENKPILPGHLLLSLFFTAPDFSRNKKIMILTSNVVFEVLLQSLLLEYNNNKPVVAGVVSAIVVAPLSLFLVALLKGSKGSRLLEFIGIFLMVGIVISSFVGVYILKINQMWYIAFLCGFATEVVVSESILMGFRKVLDL